MFRSNIKIAWRNLLKDRSFTLLNGIGLTTGLTCVFLISLWLNDEWQFDKFNANDGRLYQVMLTTKKGGVISATDGTSSAVGETIRTGMPEVEYAVTMTPAAWFQKFNVSYRSSTVGAAGNFVGKDFFNVFTYTLLEGNKDNVLSDKHSIVISQQLAKKLFSTTENIVGRSIKWKWLTFAKQCIITGVYKEAPANSSYHFDFVLPLDAWANILQGASAPANTSVNVDGPFNTYLVLKEGVELQQFKTKMTGFAKQAFTGLSIQNATTTLFLRKYSDGYLYGNYENGKQAGGRIDYLKLFSLVALFILMIASINFMNLSTAKASRRIKEIGIKKALGAGRQTLILQFLGESMLISFVSMFLALLLTALLLPRFNIITGKNIGIQLTPSICLAIVSITLVTGLMAGAYPALYLSRFNVVPTLKGQFTSSLTDLWARKGLVVFQFTLSAVFIIAVMVVHNQIKFVETKTLGYNKDNVIYFETEGTVADKKESFLSELKNIPGVVNASTIMSSLITPASTPNPGVYWNGKNGDDHIRFYQTYVNYDFTETLGIQMAEGRAFSRSFGSDTSGIILNEAAVAQMELTHPIGQIVNIYNKDWHVVGVAKNFHFNSLREPIRPFIFKLEPQSTMMVMARIRPDHQKETIQKIGDFYRTFNPGYVFDYKYLDDDYQAQYASDKLVASLSGYFAGLAILISCLGLFGLAAFTAERRRKEVGIRKVLGASVGNITVLLSVDFLKLVLIAMLIAFPLAWRVMNEWLQGFSYRVSVGPWIFLAAGVSTGMITLLAVVFQALRTAFTNPVSNLKSE